MNAVSAELVHLDSEENENSIQTITIRNSSFTISVILYTMFSNGLINNSVTMYASWHTKELNEYRLPMITM